MPEAFAILTVTLFVVIILAVSAFNSAARSPGEKLAQLQQRLAWLEERERLAEARRWDGQMRANLADQLAETRRTIAKITAPTD